MVERYFSVIRPLFMLFAGSAILASTACTTTGRTGPAPVDDASIGVPSSTGVSTVSGVSLGEAAVDAPGATSGGTLGSEEIQSADLMGGTSSAVISNDTVVSPPQVQQQRNIALASQNPVISNLMMSADTAYGEERWEDAASILERALRIEPGNGLLWQRLAEVRFAQGDYLQTVQLASKSDALAGSNRTLRTDNLILMIESYEAMGDFEQAEALRQNASERVSRTSR